MSKPWDHSHWVWKKPSHSDAKTGLPQNCSDLPIISGSRGRKDFMKPWMCSSWGRTWLFQVRKVPIFRQRGQGASVPLSEPKEVVLLSTNTVEEARIEGGRRAVRYSSESFWAQNSLCLSFENGDLPHQRKERGECKWDQRQGQLIHQAQ